MLQWSVTVSAYDFEVDGIYYNIVSESELKVEVTYDKIYNSNSNPFYKCFYYGDISIPSSVNYNGKTYQVTKIGNYAFATTGTSSSYEEPEKYLKSIQLPQTIANIGQYAFYNCQSLKSITLPKQLKYIQSHAFESCPLIDLSLPELLQRVDEYAFKDCKMTSLVIPKNVKVLNYQALPTTLREVVMLPNVPPEIGTRFSSYTRYYGGSSTTEIMVTSKTAYEAIRVNGYKIVEMLTPDSYELIYTGKAPSVS